MARVKHDVRSIADRYWNEQVARLGPIIPVQLDAIGYMDPTKPTPEFTAPFWMGAKPKRKRAPKGGRAALKALLTAKVPA
jgi:hypothetical protein